jgi:hypothetical protein
MAKTYKVKSSSTFGTAFLGNKAYKTIKLPEGYAPPGKGYNKPFNYKLWNKLRKMHRVR